MLGLMRAYKKPLLRTSANYKFIYLGGFAAAQTDVEAYEATGAFARMAMPYGGHIVRATVQSSSARTGGTLTIAPTKNGTALTATDLNLTLDGTNTTKHYRSVSEYAQGYAFSAGDEIGVKLTSSALWANSLGDLQATLFVVFYHYAGGA